MAEAMDESGLKALLDEEIKSSIAYDDTELSDKRTRYLEYYRGEMTDTPARSGGSSVVSRDVADTIGWMLPGIIRVFTASDRMAEYEPVTQRDEAFAEQATDYCNYVFWKDNPGYRILWDVTHDSLLQGNGIVKHYWDDSEECDYFEHSGMTEEQIALLMQEPGVEITAQSKDEIQVMEGQEGPVQVQTYSIKLKRVTRNGTLRVEAIEPENFLLDKEATCIEEARFCAHRDEVTRTKLIEMGFDRDIVDGLSPSHETGLREEELARNELYDTIGQTGDESMALIEIYECYIRADMDGDGKAETVRAYYAGQAGAGELLDWEVWDDDLPFSDIPCEPVPHRWDARSVADETLDIQRIKTVLLRQMLDNLYASNTPQQEAEQGSVLNPEALTKPKFGQIIWRKPGSTPIVRHEVPFVADKAMVGLEYMDAVAEKRTGVSRSTMALDPETLQNQTATANQNQRDAAYSQIELIARNQAELGWRRVFRQILKLIVKHQDRPRIIRLRDEWVEMDPRSWNAKMDVTINVGLGTGSRDRDMAMLQQVLAGQVMLADKAMAGGMPELSVEMLPRIIKTMVKIAESSGLKNPTDFFPEMGPEAVQQMMAKLQEMKSQPDPKVQAEQARLEFEKEKTAAELQMDQQKTQAQMQADQQKMTTQAELDREKMREEMALRREQIAAEMNLKREQLGAELMLKRELSMAEMEMKKEVGFYSADMKSATSQVHVGGDPG